MMQIRGALTALVTPMKADESIDYEGFRTLLRLQLKKGINGLVPLGSTGEASTIERDEQDKIIAMVVEEVAGKVPIIVGAGTNSTAHTIKNAKRVKDLGADAILIVTPYYVKPTNEGIYRHFAALAEAVDIPIVVYNIKSRTGTNIDVPTLDRLSRIPTVIGVKESSGDLAQITDIIRIVAEGRKGEGKPFSVLSGDDSFALPLCALGGDGVISVLSNLVPEAMLDLVNACLSQDYGKARTLHHALVPLFKAMFIETNPIPIKKAMDWAGLPSGPTRLPLCAMEQENEAKLRSALLEAGVALKN